MNRHLLANNINLNIERLKEKVTFLKHNIFFFKTGNKAEFNKIPYKFIDEIRFGDGASLLKNSGGYNLFEDLPKQRAELLALTESYLINITKVYEKALKAKEQEYKQLWNESYFETKK